MFIGLKAGIRKLIVYTVKLLNLLVIKLLKQIKQALIMSIGIFLRIGREN